MNWTYTNIQHGPRLEIGVSLNEYCVLDIYYKSQSSPIHSVDGWSQNTYAEISEFLGLSKGAVHKIVDRCVSRGLMEVNPANPKQKRTTEDWYLRAYERVQKVNEHKSGVQKVNKSVQKVNAKVSKVNANVQKVNDIIGINITKEELKDKHTKARVCDSDSKVESSDSTAALTTTPTPPSPPPHAAPKDDGIPVSEYTTAVMTDYYSGGDVCFENIWKRVGKYFAESESWESFCQHHGCKISKADFITEAKQWIRRNMVDRPDFFCDPIKFLRGGRGNLVGWLQADWKPYWKNSSASRKQQQPAQTINRNFDVSTMYC